MSDIQGTAIVAGIITAVGGVVTAVLGRRPKTDKADYADRLVGASIGLVDQLQEEIVELRSDATECKGRLAELQRETLGQAKRYDRLERYLKSLGLEIPPEVPTD